MIRECSGGVWGRTKERIGGKETSSKRNDLEKWRQSKEGAKATSKGNETNGAENAKGTNTNDSRNWESDLRREEKKKAQAGHGEEGHLSDPINLPSGRTNDQKPTQPWREANLRT